MIKSTKREYRRLPARPGFTLIELLIVVAIIGILAAIAVPNFLNAQTRAKVSRVLSDERAIVLAADSYRIDNNAYPYPKSMSRHVSEVYELTTPVSYLSSIAFDDPFNTEKMDEAGLLQMNYTSYIWGSYRGEWGHWWAGANGAEVSQLPVGISINSSGPDHAFSQAMHIPLQERLGMPVTGVIYDPSNGLYSGGDIVTYGGEVAKVGGH